MDIAKDIVELVERHIKERANAEKARVFTGLVDSANAVHDIYSTSDEAMALRGFIDAVVDAAFYVADEDRAEWERKYWSGRQ